MLHRVGDTIRGVLLRTILGIILLAISSSPAIAQLASPEEALDQLELLLSTGRSGDALNLIEQIGQSFPGSEEYAAALMQKGGIEMDRGQVDTALDTFTGVRDAYPRSVAAILASKRIASVKLLAGQYSTEQYLAAMDSTIQEAGGLSLSSLPSNDSWTEVSYLTRDEQTYALFSLYTDATWGILTSTAPVSEELLNTAEATARLIRSRYPQTDEGADQLLTIESIRTNDPSLLERTREQNPPKLNFETNSPISASTPVVVELHDGPASQSQVSLRTLKVNFGSVELQPFRINSSDGSAVGALEKLEVFVVPDAGWPTGQNVLAVSVSDIEGNVASAQFTFEVKNDPPPGPLSLSANKDSIVLVKESHRNEGANPLLTLAKINGKAARDVVGFDLSNAQVVGLTSATLVFTINPNEHVNGWGNGETVTVQTVNTPWTEGNGRSFGLKKKDEIDGTGPGVTWFSPIDENISNDSPNSVVQWDGGSLNANPATAPPVTVTNHQTGEISFDVTQDVLNGAEHGWLLSKDKENKGSKISFYSKEGAAAAGNPDLAPRLILEYDGSSADAGTNAGQSVASSGHNYLKAVTRTTEGPTIKEVLQENATVAYTGQLLLTLPLNKAPVAQAAVRTAYRSWLNDSLTLASLSRHSA